MDDTGELEALVWLLRRAERALARLDTQREMTDVFTHIWDARYMIEAKLGRVLVARRKSGGGSCGS